MNTRVVLNKMGIEVCVGMKKHEFVAHTNSSLNETP